MIRTSNKPTELTLVKSQILFLANTTEGSQFILTTLTRKNIGVQVVLESHLIVKVFETSAGK